MSRAARPAAGARGRTRLRPGVGAARRRRLPVARPRRRDVRPGDVRCRAPRRGRPRTGAAGRTASRWPRSAPRSPRRSRRDRNALSLGPAHRPDRRAGGARRVCASPAPCLAAAAFVSSFAALFALLFLAGGLGASVNSASGRAVMHWFDAASEGLPSASGRPRCRSAAPPSPSGCRRSGRRPIRSRPCSRSRSASPSAVSSVSPCFGRDRTPTPEARRPRRATPLRDRGMWVLSIGSALLVAPQACLIGFLVLFLHDHRGVATESAALVLAAVNLLGIGTRIGAGRWSDLAGSRLGPLRRIALASAVLVACCALPRLGAAGRPRAGARPDGLRDDQLERALVRRRRRGGGTRAERQRDRPPADRTGRLRRRAAGRLRRVASPSRVDGEVHPGRRSSRSQVAVLASLPG